MFKLIKTVSEKFWGKKKNCLIALGIRAPLRLLFLLHLEIIFKYLKFFQMKELQNWNQESAL